MFDIIDDVTKEMLQESGEVQRAYTVAIVYENAYDFYMNKHKTGTDVLTHAMAERFALGVVSVVFGTK